MPWCIIAVGDGSYPAKFTGSIFLMNHYFTGADIPIEIGQVRWWARLPWGPDEDDKLEMASLPDPNDGLNTIEANPSAR